MNNTQKILEKSKGRLDINIKDDNLKKIIE